MRYLFNRGLFVMSFTIGLLLACTSGEDQLKSATVKGHYAYQSNGDTILMDLEQEKDSVYGDLKYAFSGKDKNIGKITGRLKDSMIVADYNFISEGVPSVREIVFKLTSQGLIEGYGQIEENNGKVIFSDKTNLSFDHGMVLVKE